MGGALSGRPALEAQGSPGALKMLVSAGHLARAETCQRTRSSPGESCHLPPSRALMLPGLLTAPSSESSRRAHGARQGRANEN